MRDRQPVLADGPGTTLTLAILQAVEIDRLPQGDPTVAAGGVVGPGVDANWLGFIPRRRKSPQTPKVSRAGIADRTAMIQWNATRCLGRGRPRPRVGNAAGAAGLTAGNARLHCRDHPVFRSGLAQSLRRVADVEIATVGGTADEAVRAANTASIDVLLLDLTIPGDGKEAARRILRENPAARILILTGSNKEEDVAATLAIGAMGYVQKGASGREIIHAIRTVYRGQPYVTQELSARMLVQQSRATPKPTSATGEPRSRPALGIREQQILDLASKGFNNREIAATLGLSVATIKHYISLVVRKWGVRNRVEAVVLHSRKPTGS